MPHGCDPAEALVYLRKRYEGGAFIWCGWGMPMPSAPRPILAI
jgi:hypothetical protein